jgi:hypothetical protein
VIRTVVSDADYEQLAQVAQAQPTSFTPLYDFCDNILEDFNQLPTIIYRVLLSTMKMPGRLQIAFGANLLHPLISGKPPNYFICEPTQEDFESRLLPLKANAQSFAANAKIALILEHMFMYMFSQEAFTSTSTLRKAVETGIEARYGVHGTNRGRKGNAKEEQQAKELMEASSERLLGLLEMLEMTAEKPLHPMNGKRNPGVVSASLSFGSGSSLSPAPESDTGVDD